MIDRRSIRSSKVAGRGSYRNQSFSSGGSEQSNNCERFLILHASRRSDSEIGDFIDQGVVDIDRVVIYFTFLLGN